MRGFWTVVCFFLPSAVGVPLRRLLGARIAPGARIRWLTWLDAPGLELGEKASIGPLTFVRAKRVTLGRRASLRPLSFAKLHTLELGDDARNAPFSFVVANLAPRARLVLGAHSQIFPFCWIEPGEGVTVGAHVGIGGHTFIFTHGSWSDYLRGGPVRKAPVTIEDRVWLPWRVTVLAGATIGHDSVVLSGSVVSRPLPPRSLCGGSPAQVLREGPGDLLPAETRRDRVRHILEDWVGRRQEEGAAARLAGDRLVDESATVHVVVDATVEPEAVAGDLVFAAWDTPIPSERVERWGVRGVSVVDHAGGSWNPAANAERWRPFVDFLRTYGIRLSEVSTPVRAPGVATVSRASESSPAPR